MPLSEDEQRILQDIERSFYENDPAFARAVSSPGLYRHAARNIKLSIAGFVMGLALLLATFTVAPLAAFAGFVVMVVCAGFAAQNLRHVSAAGLRDVASSDRAKHMNDSLNGACRRLLRRFGKS